MGPVKGKLNGSMCCNDNGWSVCTEIDRKDLITEQDSSGIFLPPAQLSNAPQLRLLSDLHTLGPSV